MSTETIWLLSAEIVLIVAAVSIYLAGAFVDARGWWSGVAAAAIAAAAVALWCMQKAPPTAGGPLAIDALAYYGRWLALALGALFVLLTSRPASRPLDTDTPGTSEYVGSLLLAVAGLMLACCAGELVLLFVGLELISIPTYILLYLGRPPIRRDTSMPLRWEAASQESAAKYFFLSILASAMLLYGFSFLYGTTGSTDLWAIRAALAGPSGAAAGFGGLVKVAWVLIFAGLGFKIAAVPFHFYAPDVYQGTTYPNAGLLSVVPKAAGLVVLVRILVVAMPGLEPYAWRVTLVLSVLTMTLGNVMALWQDNLRRLLAYSSVAHAGYMLIGLTVGLVPVAAQGKWDGVSALLLYLCVYAVATVGTFAALEFLGRRQRQIESVEELAGLGRTQPMLAVCIAVFMFSLAGIPPLAGFWGKLGLFGSAVSVAAGNLSEKALWPWFVALAVLGVLNAAVAAAYYLRIVAVMYFRTPLATPKPRGGAGAWLTMTACAVLTILIGIYPGWLFQQADTASPRTVAGAPDGQASLAAGIAGEDSERGSEGSPR